MVDITEIYLHWYAGRSKSELAASLGVDRKTVRKYLVEADQGVVPRARLPVVRGRCAGPRLDHHGRRTRRRRDAGAEEGREEGRQSEQAAPGRPWCRTSCGSCSSGLCHLLHHGRRAVVGAGMEIARCWP